MHEGFATAVGLIAPTPTKPRLVFVETGEPTSVNPLRALQQGLEARPQNEAYLLRGHRCPACGMVELVATEQVEWAP
jgi:hypothetical protein